MRHEWNTTTPPLINSSLSWPMAHWHTAHSYDTLKSEGLKEERLVLLEAWRDAEAAAVDAAAALIAAAAASADLHPAGQQGGSSGGSNSSSNSSSDSDSGLLLDADVREAVLAAQQAGRRQLEELESRFPRKVKMRRPVLGGPDGETEVGTEEYFDYLFPDDQQKAQAGMKLLEKAMMWKKMAAVSASASSAAATAAEGDADGAGGASDDNSDEDEDEGEGEGEGEGEEEGGMVGGSSNQGSVGADANGEVDSSDESGSSDEAAAATTAAAEVAGILGQKRHRVQDAGEVDISDDEN